MTHITLIKYITYIKLNTYTSMLAGLRQQHMLGCQPSDGTRNLRAPFFVAEPHTLRLLYIWHILHLLHILQILQKLHISHISHILHIFHLMTQRPMNYICCNFIFFSSKIHVSQYTKQRIIQNYIPQLWQSQVKLFVTSVITISNPHQTCRITWKNVTL